MGASGNYVVTTTITQNGRLLGKMTWESASPPVILPGMSSQPALSLTPVVGPTDFACAIEAWEADMRRRGKKPGTLRVFTAQIRKLSAWCGWDRVADADFAGASAYLAAMREAKGWSGPTTDGVVSAFKAFARFCHASGLVPQDPFLALGRSHEVGGPGNRALTLDEARRLVLVGIAACRDRRARAPRGLWYGFLFLTGLRTHEAGLCRWGDVDFDPKCPAIYTAPEWTKNGRRQRVVLAPELIPKLEEWRRCVPSGRTDPVFPRKPNKGTFALDRQAAGIPELDGRQRRCGPHSCRKSLATWLYDAGVSSAVIERIIRHGGSLTQARYIDPDPRMELEAIKKLPRVFPSVDNFAGAQVPENARDSKCSRGFVPDRLQNRGDCAEDVPAVVVHPDQSKPPPVPQDGYGKYPERKLRGVTSSGRERPGPAKASAAGREAPSGASRDQNRPRFQGRSGYFGPENDPVLIFARAIERLGRMLERQHDHGSDED